MLERRPGKHGQPREMSAEEIPGLQAWSGLGREGPSQSEVVAAARVQPAEILG